MTKLEYYLNELDKAIKAHDLDYTLEIYNALDKAGYANDLSLEIRDSIAEQCLESLKNSLNPKNWS
jgi:hypothetical protein